MLRKLAPTPLVSCVCIVLGPRSTKPPSWQFFLLNNCQDNNVQAAIILIDINMFYEVFDPKMGIPATCFLSLHAFFHHVYGWYKDAHLCCLYPDILTIVFFFSVCLWLFQPQLYLEAECLCYGLASLLLHGTRIWQNLLFTDSLCNLCSNFWIWI